MADSTPVPSSGSEARPASTRSMDAWREPGGKKREPAATRSADEGSRIVGGFYLLQGQVGLDGSTGRVFRAWDTRLDRPVAIKFPITRVGEASPDPELCARVIREATILASLSHPHIVQVFSLLDDDGNPGLVMEVLEQTLAEALYSFDPGWRVALQYAEQILEAIDTVHTKSLLHRDIKHDNIMVDERGNLKLGDFGHAKRTLSGVNKDANATNGTFSSERAGTDGWCPPEVLCGRDYSIQSDLFGVGELIHWMITKSDWFDHHAFFDFEARSAEHFLTLESCPDSVIDIVRKATRYEPRERFATASEMLDAVRGVLSANRLAATQSDSPSRKGRGSLQEVRGHDRSMNSSNCCDRSLAEGRIKLINCNKGYALIAPNTGRELVFLHHSRMDERAFQSLKVGDCVKYVSAFDIQWGPLAINLQEVRKAAGEA